jgi:hypothetical protein
LRAKIETMDFFAAQEKALQRTKRLVAMFGLAVAARSWPVTRSWHGL